MASRNIEVPPERTWAEPPVILVRVYRGYHERAVEVFEEDAAQLVDYGYVPVAQSYADGRYSDLVVVLATALILFAIGLLVLLYMAAVRPAGSLAVTYVLRDALPSMAR